MNDRDQNPRYPYREGETLVLGPAIFAAADGSVINWKGANYTPREESYITPAALLRGDQP